MSETDHKVHDRVNYEAIAYIREFSQFPYIAYTEHIAALARPPPLLILPTSP